MIIEAAEKSQNSVIVIAIDNVAACYAVQRQASFNKVAARYLDEMTQVLHKTGCRVVVVPIPGCYNVADWPSRNLDIPMEKHTRELKAWRVGLEREFVPPQKTWDVPRLGYQGSRIDVPVSRTPPTNACEGLRHPDEQGEEE